MSDTKNTQGQSMKDAKPVTPAGEPTVKPENSKGGVSALGEPTVKPKEPLAPLPKIRTLESEGEVRVVNDNAAAKGFPNHAHVCSKQE